MRAAVRQCRFPPVVTDGGSVTGVVAGGSVGGGGGVVSGTVASLTPPLVVGVGLLAYVRGVVYELW